MVDVRRVTLPGVGVLHSFTTDDGAEVAVVAHRTGSSDLVSRPAGAHSDDDATTLRLDEEEAHALADLLGGTRIVESIAELDELPGVPIDWVTIDGDDAIAGRAIGDVPSASGVALVAVVREDHAFPAPPPDFVVRPGDTVVAVGPTEGIEAIFRAIREGTGLLGDAEA
jgi:TrkA domain protein